jgi:hypothetical protein
MATIVTRAGKGSALTFTEGDANFTNLNNDKIENVVEDTTPQLGGNLDGQGNEVTDVQLDNYKEVIYTEGSTTGTITPDVANGNVQVITLSGNITFNAFANAETGQSITLIIKQPASGGPYTLTSTMLFARASGTLSTDASAVDVMTVFYDGTSYYASLATGFASVGE